MLWWTREEIESILLQLEEQGKLFDKYRFLKNERGGLNLLGKGAYAYVFEAQVDLLGEEMQVAFAVIGFGNRRMEPIAFEQYMKLQEKAGFWQDHIVWVLDHKQLYLKLGDHGEMLDAGEEEEENRLRLQFIIMEKLEPVIRRDDAGVYRLFPKELEMFSEEEILRLACDIGQGIKWVHDHGIIHRDIKLENVFCSPTEKVYKLGDFGIAKQTRDGEAYTMAYTNGYGAPEVIGRTLESYDQTADLYSFGILLYVLLNRLKFPRSEGYWPDESFQYEKGVVFPRPETGSERFCQIVGKLCAYDPDKRYQSIDEVLLEFKGLAFPPEIAFLEKHAKLGTVLGKIFLLCGTACFILGKQDWLMVFFFSNSVWLFLFYLSSKVSIDGYRNIKGIRKFVLLLSLLANEILIILDFCTRVQGIAFSDHGFWAYVKKAHLAIAGCLGIICLVIWEIQIKVRLLWERRTKHRKAKDQ